MSIRISSDGRAVNPDPQIFTADSPTTLTNKTLDADKNIITNLELDNLKTGVVDTDGTLSADSDAVIPTQRAVKEYVDSFSYSDEQAQDAVAGIITDTDTIDAVYVDATPTLSFNARLQMSVTSDGSGIKLSGDSASPGNYKHYGTNASGTKGFYDSHPPITFVTPSQITGHVNDYNPTDWDRATYVRLDSNGLFYITSAAASTVPKTLINVGSRAIIIPHQHPSGTAANRFITGTTGIPFILTPGNTCTIIYDSTLSRWVVSGTFDIIPQGGYRNDLLPGSVTAGDLSDITYTVASGTVGANAVAATKRASIRHTVTAVANASTVTIGKNATSHGFFGTDFMVASHNLYSGAALSNGTDGYSLGLRITSAPVATTDETANSSVIKYTHAISANFNARTIDNGGTPNPIDTGVVFATTTIYNLTIVVNSQNTEHLYYINGNNVGMSTSNLPAGTVAGYQFYIIKTIGANARFVDTNSGTFITLR